MESQPVKTTPTPPREEQEDKEVEIEIHDQKPGMTGRFRIREPTCPRGKTQTCEPRLPPHVQEMEAIQKRNAILEAAARQQEAKQKEQEERLKKAEERMEKMASLLAQLISK